MKTDRTMPQELAKRDKPDYPSPDLPVDDTVVAQKEVAPDSLLSFQYSAPLPPPAMLADYDKAVPNGAERIMKMAEEQQRTRISNETLQLKEGVAIEKRGQVFAFSICIFALSVSAILAFTGHEVTASIIGGIDLVALAFVFNKASQG